MCGFAGFIERQSSVTDSLSILKQMGDAIMHRGPDDSGEWFDDRYKVGMAHRRLSILDLSYAGHQPAKSASERYLIVFNGEIYNHLKIRQELEVSSGLIAWRGHSDTETLLAGFDVWGVQATIERTTGMFAFAVWDRKKEVLILGRDRIGEKPLYYGWQDNTFLFGSELKAFKQHPAFKAEINRDAIVLLLRYNYIPAPYSIYQDISKLEPGHLLTVSLANPEPKIWPYWSAIDIVMNGANRPFMGTLDEGVDRLESLAMDAVSQQMMADVPLGAFLSGGVDSSLVAALMQNQSTHPIKTFTIGFHEQGYNEAIYAKAVARHLGTEHTELYVTHEEAMNIIPKLPTLYCEPFSDSSQIPTFLVSQLAKQHVTVSLSGDGGDELFCGYNRYQMTHNIWKKLNMMPIPLRVLLAKGIKLVSPQDWDSMAKYIPKARHFNNIGDKLYKGAGVLDSRTIDDLYLGLVSHHRDPKVLVVGGMESSTRLTDNAPDLAGLSDVQRMMALDLVTYLPDDILVKVDRAAMGISLETRVPFLDHNIVEFAWTLPMSMKIRDGQSKWLLRQVLYKYVPKKLIERPKMGFGVPIGSWLRGPLRDWAENLLDESRLNQEGYLNPTPIRKMWKEHLSGQRNWQYNLWNILMFQAWLEQESSTH
jgi:asparagine synthase (glutamine-hydrolysing)